MSLIHTCNLMKINPFKYLVALQKHSASLFKDPARWMPWNYEDALTALVRPPWLSEYSHLSLTTKCSKT